MRLGAPARLVIPAWLVVGAIAGALACGDEAGGEPSPPPFCADIEKMSTCENRVGCLWDTDAQTCVYECLPYEDEATCEAQESCVWLDDTCEHGSL